MARAKAALARVYFAVRYTLVKYPALTGAVVNVGVVVAAYFGVHISGDQLLYMLGVAATLIGAVVHQSYPAKTVSKPGPAVKEVPK